MQLKFIVPAVLIKGSLIATLLSVVAETTFVQGLVTAVASACISGFFLLFSIHLSSKRAEQKVAEIKETVDEAKKEITQVVENGNN